MRLLTVLLLGAFATSPSWGQDSQDYDQYLGFAAGTSTGMGLSYRSWTGTFGYQVTAAPLISNYRQSGSLGIAGLWTLSDLQWTKFFTYGGAAAQVGQDDWDPEWAGQATLGAGIGFEFIWFDHIALDLMAGYGFQTSFPKMNTFGTNFTVETGLFYRTTL